MRVRPDITGCIKFYYFILFSAHTYTLPTLNNTFNNIGNLAWEPSVAQVTHSLYRRLPAIGLKLRF